LGEFTAAVAEMLTSLVGGHEALEMGAVREMISSGLIPLTAAIDVYRARIKKTAEHVRGVLSRVS
jgi:hypothetical protein